MPAPLPSPFSPLTPQAEAYAHPTAVGAVYDAPSRRTHHSGPFSGPSPFTALSSVAMEELAATDSTSPPTHSAEPHPPSCQHPSCLAGRVAAEAVPRASPIPS